MKKTHLYDQHLKLNAKMVDFTGFSMPIWYSSIIDEHIHVRNACGLFDVSHMAEFYIKGKGSTDFIDKLTTNSIRSMNDGKVLYTLLCDEEGGCIDDLLVYRFNNELYMIVANACNRISVFEWFSKHASSFDIEIEDKTDEISMIAIQGPGSVDALQKIGFSINDDFLYYTYSYLNCNDINYLCSRTGYTGEEGFEIFGAGEEISKIWQMLLSSDADVRPIGLGARDTLRMECCFSLYGHEISRDITPLEAGLSWAVDKNKEFIGKSAMINKGRGRVLAGFDMIERGIPRPELEIYSSENKRIGFVTSGSFLPFIKKNMGLCIIDAEFASLDNEINIDIRGKKKKARIVKRPFYIPCQRRRKDK
ncbi:MAG: glycine cleavage system aminomethyltransferase GcvT [Candidatus Aureabacteria bacterium]|nr:glycine cleavage system aminomethyltransferase GcvT [Candidatus Auribacterota bacterium]